MINIPKGTKDILPKEAFRWRFVEETARRTAEEFNVKEIRTPVFEHTEVFARGVGTRPTSSTRKCTRSSTRGGRSVTLKPEGTSAVVRSLIENGLFNETLPLKLYYITPCFRYERPQAGRLRDSTSSAWRSLGARARIPTRKSSCSPKRFSNGWA